MTTTAKITATLGAGGASLIGCYAGGVFSSAEEVSIESTPIVILWSPLNKETNFTTTYNTDNTVGKEYGQYLTGTGETNQKWWEEAYKQYEANKSNTDSLHEMFASGKIDSAYSTTNIKALNKVCGEAYKKNLTNDVNFSSTTTTDNNYKLAANILKYCSPLGQKPTIIQTNNNTYSEGKIGKQGNAKNLVSSSEDANDGFWKAQNEWFKAKGASSTSLDNYFNQFFVTNGTTKALSENQTIKKICEETYKKEAITDGDATTSQPKIDDVVKYCSFKKLSENS